MKLVTFRSDKGDCLLLHSADGASMLVDGGMSSSYTEHVAPYLDRMRRNGESLDVVCVSHIDQDHIQGVLRMANDLVDWRVHDFQHANGNTAFKKPKSKRPPEVGRFWHNAFHEQIGDNAGQIADMLAAEAAVLSGHPSQGVREHALSLQGVALGEADAIRLSRRIGDRQLNIPLNPEYDQGLMFHATPAEPISVGSMDAFVIGPFEDDLKDLRDEWNDWLRTHQKFLEGVRESAKKTEDQLGNTDEVPALQTLMESQAIDLASAQRLADQINLATASGTLGKRYKVSTPNLASLMLLVEENGRTVLLTGDGHCDDIADGLDLAGLLRDDGSLHVDVLKVAHHGSEHNTSEAFCRKITADIYIFCGNGAHHNPDLRVVSAYIDSRLGTAAELSPNTEVGNNFRLVFNNHPDNPELSSAEADHMAEVHELVTDRAADSSGQMQAVFLDRSYHTITMT
ncbi:MAG: hypothetical protein DHS20C14_15590 [Phycisphaeraceae bacterium]|nr:MAG: hypothetical protein DHS20C14_15590 [Phycisphaeraceae bacterium]